MPPPIRPVHRAARPRPPWLPQPLTDSRPSFSLRALAPATHQTCKALRDRARHDAVWEAYAPTPGRPRPRGLRTDGSGRSRRRGRGCARFPCSSLCNDVFAISLDLQQRLASEGVLLPSPERQGMSTGQSGQWRAFYQTRHAALQPLSQERLVALYADVQSRLEQYAGPVDHAASGAWARLTASPVRRRAPWGRLGSAAATSSAHTNWGHWPRSC